MSELTIRAGGIEIATEAFGDPEDAPVLLIMGAMASMLWWPEEFCQRLAGNGRYVIRYDSRDTGRSTTQAPGAASYTGDDMADDVIRVLDGYRISGHLVGMSMGGVLAQLAALKYSARVHSLTVISSSPFGEDTSALPGPTPAYGKHAAQFVDLDWTDRAQVIRFMVAETRALGSSVHPFGETRARKLIERDYDRARNFASATNHLAVEGGGAGWQGRLRELRAPLLVIHGTADPLFPIEHGVALANMVPGARLVRLEGGGHELHEADWDKIIAAIIDHTGRN